MIRYETDRLNMVKVGRILLPHILVQNNWLIGWWVRILASHHLVYDDSKAPNVRRERVE